MEERDRDIAKNGFAKIWYSFFQVMNFVWAQVIYRCGTPYGEKTRICFPKGEIIDTLKKNVIEELKLKNQVSAMRVAVRAAEGGDNEKPEQLVEELLKKCSNNLVYFVLLDLDEGT